MKRTPVWRWKMPLEGFVPGLRFSTCKIVFMVFMYLARMLVFSPTTRRLFCPKFHCLFHLWGNGGPDWKKEFRRWQVECDEEWTLVSPSKRRARLGLAAMEKSPPKSAIKSPASKNKKVKFATFMNYEACKGYRFLPMGRDTQ